MLVHGSGLGDRDETIGPNKPFRDLAWGLADRGIAVRDRIDPKRIVVLDQSLGATLAPRIAAEDHALAGIIIMAGATRPLMDVVRDQLTYLASLNPGAGTDPEKGVADLRSHAPESYWKDLDAYSPTQTAAKLTIPILVLQGERDYQVTMKDLQGWQDALRERHLCVAVESRRRVGKLSLPSLLAPSRRGSLRTGSWRLHFPTSRPRPHAAHAVRVIRSDLRW